VIASFANSNTEKERAADRKSLIAESHAESHLTKFNQNDPIHPGEILLEEFLKPFGVSQYELAKVVGVSPRRINEIVHGKRAISPDSALRLARAFDVSDRFWLNLQARYDLEIEKLKLAETLPNIKAFKLAV
jgi:addiction module HigA family antidote